jgi:glycine cleavage system aminomethyltransferase T/glycine/D-amino acid oxidase-like deaminating enzyme
MSADHARVVVIGGGITGCSVAYHLALAGWTDVLLVEKAQLTAGSTCQAAGLVTAFNPSSTMMRFRQYSIELYRSLGAFETVGSLRLASSPAQLRELQRTASRARGLGLDAGVIGPDEARRLMPAISPDSLYGAVHLAGDGYLDPHGATHAVADAARALGVRIRTGVRVTGFELSARREVTRVLTDGEPIDTELVVNAAGIWAPQVAAMVGAWVPSTPVDHQHIALKAVPGSELPPDMPCFRDPDNLVYGKAEHGGMVFGGYELDPVSRWEDGVPWDHAARSLPPDYERFGPLMAGAIRRFPFLADAEAIRLVCHPDAMTPDANPLLGPLPGVRGFWVAAGLSLNGFGGGGGIGRAIAGWITSGDPGLDVGPYRAWRFGETYRDPRFAAGLARETYSDYYRLRYPFDADLAGRPRRLSALHGRLQETGAVFGTKAGWERADLHEPGRPWRRAGRDQAAYGWGRPPWLDRVIAEVAAVREQAGMIDLSSFGKIDIAGPGALRLLQRVSANDVDRPVGSIVYTPWCDERGGIVADVTITKLGEERFRVVTGAGYVASELAWLRANGDEAEAADAVSIVDVSGEHTTIGLWGPRAREILAATTDDDTTDAGLPLRRARPIKVGGAPVLASRLSYAGELGWELTMDAAWAVTVWDRLWEAGRPVGLEPFGYRALDSLRMEKGFRYFGTDVTMLETPHEAGLGAFVRLDTGEFIGRDALRAAAQAPEDGTTRRLRTLRIGGPDWLPVYGGEAVRLDGEVIGRLRSVAFGPTVPATIGFAYCPASLAEGTALELDVFDTRIPAEITRDVLVDPEGLRMRG